MTRPRDGGGVKYVDRETGTDHGRDQSALHVVSAPVSFADITPWNRFAMASEQGLEMGWTAPGGIDAPKCGLEECMRLPEDRRRVPSVDLVLRTISKSGKLTRAATTRRWRARLEQRSRRSMSNPPAGGSVRHPQGVTIMRLPTAMLAACLLPSMAWAQVQRPPEKVWTAAPVPGRLPSAVSPADRAGDSTGTDASSPFSSTPLGARTDSRPNDITRDGGSPGTDSVTPNLSR